MLKDKRRPNGPMIDLLKQLLNDGNELSQTQKRKCHQKFESFKPLGSTVISKSQLRKVLRDLGKQVSQEELLQMIEQADPNGYGYVSYEAFEKLVQLHKQKKEQQTTESIQLTFQDILKAEKREKKNQYVNRISWDFLQKYLFDHFELQINIKSMKGSSSSDSISRQEFKKMFS